MVAVCEALLVTHWMVGCGVSLFFVWVMTGDCLLDLFVFLVRVELGGWLALFLIL